MTSPLQKHLKKEQKRREERKNLNLSLQEASGVVSMPGEFLEKLSVAYHDQQTSLNNLDQALMIVRTLEESQARTTGLHQNSQLPQESQTTNQAKSKPQDGIQASQTQTSQSSTNPPSLQRISRQLRNLEIRQISTVRRMRKLLRLLGCRQSFVDQLEGISSVYEDDSDPEIDIEKNLGLMERNAETE